MAQTRTGTRRRTSPKTSRQRLRVSFADADRVRRHLLSEQVEVLTTRDIRTMLKILNDVYPARKMRSQANSTRSSSLWPSFLLGIGIGLVLLLGALTVM
jgi:hypothetical protein